MEVPEIKVSPPGPKARAVLQRDSRYLSSSFPRYYPLVVESAKGSVIQDVDGNTFIDFNSGIACLNVGSSHPKVLEAIERASRKFTHYSLTDFYYENAVRLSEELSKITPGSFPKKVYLANSGTEAVEAAVKIAKWHSRRSEFIAFIGAFHGRTIGALSFTASKTVQRRYFFPLMPGVVHVPYGYCYRCYFKQTFPECGYWCVDYIREALLEKFLPREDVAGILVEPIQGEGGYVVPPEGYLQRMASLAREYDLLLIDDEIQAGMGRTGRWFGIENWDVTPDVVCIAKSIASGLPLGAMVAKEEIADWEPGSHATTFGGNPVACEAALATISVIKEENLLDRAVRMGRQVISRFKDMQNRFEIIGDVRGKGLMIGVELVKDGDSKTPAVEESREIMKRCFKQGLVVITCGASVLRIAPPLNIPEQLLEKGLNIVEDVITEFTTEKK
ncbi:MAG: acetyl ornithine aminotransferase family protein [Nitrososphaeria archaeon]